uniref:SRP9 domain-containing protein n=1 Tax=Timema shepardi TaxID=629360 RepID=A0A7R9AR44_TIMSH|nr:unnamed protein product [Timema shepardi]
MSTTKYGHASKEGKGRKGGIVEKELPSKSARAAVLVALGIEPTTVRSFINIECSYITEKAKSKLVVPCEAGRKWRVAGSEDRAVTTSYHKSLKGYFRRFLFDGERKMEQFQGGGTSLKLVYRSCNNFQASVEEYSDIVTKDLGRTNNDECSDWKVCMTKKLLNMTFEYFHDSLEFEETTCWWPCKKERICCLYNAAIINWLESIKGSFVTFLGNQYIWLIQKYNARLMWFVRPLLHLGPCGPGVEHKIKEREISFERDFSWHNRLKTAYSDSLNTETLDDLLRISVNEPSLNKFDPKVAIDEWYFTAERQRYKKSARVRYTMKYVHKDGSLTLKLTDDVVCLQYKTEILQDLKKVDKLVNNLMRHMASKEHSFSHHVEEPVLKCHIKRSYRSFLLSVLLKMLDGSPTLNFILTAIIIFITVNVSQPLQPADQFIPVLLTVSVSSSCIWSSSAGSSCKDTRWLSRLFTEVVRRRDVLGMNTEHDLEQSSEGELNGPLVIATVSATSAIEET